MQIRDYILRRLMILPLLIVGVSIIVFTLTRIGGSPIGVYLSHEMTQEEVAELKARGASEAKIKEHIAAWRREQAVKQTQRENAADKARADRLRGRRLEMIQELRAKGMAEEEIQRHVAEWYKKMELERRDLEKNKKLELEKETLELEKKK